MQCKIFRPLAAEKRWIWFSVFESQLGHPRVEEVQYLAHEAEPNLLTSYCRPLSPKRILHVQLWSTLNSHFKYLNQHSKAWRRLYLACLYVSTQQPQFNWSKSSLTSALLHCPLLDSWENSSRAVPSFSTITYPCTVWFVCQCQSLDWFCQKLNAQNNYSQSTFHSTLSANSKQ